MANRTDLLLAEKKENHFLHNWNKITYYDTSRMLLIISCIYVFVPPIVYFFVLACILSYFASYLIFKNHGITGNISLGEQFIEIEKYGEPVVRIDITDISRMVVTYKFWSNRVINKNKQVEYNAIYIQTSQTSYKLGFIIKNNNALSCLEDLFANHYSEKKEFKLLNLAFTKIDDLI